MHVMCHMRRRILACSLHAASDSRRRCHEAHPPASQLGLPQKKFARNFFLGGSFLRFFRIFARKTLFGFFLDICKKNQFFLRFFRKSFFGGQFLAIFFWVLLKTTVFDPASVFLSTHRSSQRPSLRASFRRTVTNQPPQQASFYYLVSISRNPTVGFSQLS